MKRWNKRLLFCIDFRLESSDRVGLRSVWSSHQEHAVDVLALRGDEGRRNLRKAQGSW